MTPDATIEPLIEPCPLVPTDTPCSEIASHIFSRGSRHHILVQRPDGEVGVVGREAFLGHIARTPDRSTLAHQAVGDLAVWDLPTVSERTSLTAAAVRMMSADGGNGFRDLPVIDAAGVAYGVIRPVRLMRALADSSARHAETDGLTGLASRERLMSALEEALRALRTSDSRVLVAYLTLDSLRIINDSLGHHHGDAMLRTAARQILAAAAGADVVARLAGDEFAIVTRINLPSTVAVEAAAMAFGERLRAVLSQPDPSLPSTARARASIGVVAAENPTEDPDELLRLADAAMYSAKLAGGDRVQFGRRTAEGIDKILNDALYLTYQPIVDTITGVPTAVEALLRMHRGADDESFPLDVKQRAARLGATLDLDRWILGHACRALRHWEADDFKPARGLVMHVNLSPESLVVPGLADGLLSTIRDSGVSPQRIVLELSELSRLGDLAAARAELRALDAAGVRLALDDVGISLDTLRFLQEPIPFSIIKVDRTIIRGAGRGSAVDAEVLSVISRIADELDVAVIAEGIETDRERDAVRHAGIGLQQGFLHYRPMSEPLLKARLVAATTPRQRIRAI
ncbi:EAL domain-containing protein [Demequina zhanjiangensis]|uniref:EAL domain-containing protein n=1 Tax=Demequina zhanjiangensis TaxID=3051659 RepID=A0ABT8G1A1_9MICO|nr:EAL domain-containing protein [Demequina sp. SYSU T00b26]MDN4472920.1 EAL domain-containing protein [Demequina sp. SYSU T00b26]